MIYIYSRELVSGAYNIDNPYHVDMFGQPIKLDFEINAAFPNNPSNISCAGTGVAINFASGLSVNEKEDLDALIAFHKNDTLDDIRNIVVNWRDIYGDYKRARDVIKVKVATSGFSNLSEVNKEIASAWFTVGINDRNTIDSLQEQITHGNNFHNNSTEARRKRISQLVSQCYSRLTSSQTSTLISESEQLVDEYINYGKEGSLEGNSEGFFDYVLARSGTAYSGNGIAAKDWTPSGMNNMTEFADKLMNILKSGDYTP